MVENKVQRKHLCKLQKTSNKNCIGLTADEENQPNKLLEREASKEKPHTYIAIQKAYNFVKYTA